MIQRLLVLHVVDKVPQAKDVPYLHHLGGTKEYY
jgi:hypothetical protein